MGLLEVLTIIFVVCKLAGIITWSWWVVFSPVLVALAAYLLWFVTLVVVGLIGKKKVDKSFKEFDVKFKRGIK